MLRICVREAEEGLRPDHLLRRRYPKVDRQTALKLLKSGRVFVDGERARLATAVKAGQNVVVDLDPSAAGRPADPAEPAIVFCARGVAVLDKPAGMAMHAGTGVPSDEATLRGWVRAHLEVEEGFFGPSFLGRLDRPTSGLVIAALSREGLAAVAPAWSRGEIEKAYLALVHGRLARPETIDIPLAARRPRHRGRGRIELSVTHVVPLAARRQASLLLAFPETGRTHQIRRHLKAVAHPIVGDPRYGDARRDRALGLEPMGEGAAGLMLHAFRYRHEGQVPILPPSVVAPMPDRIRHAAKGVGLEVEAALKAAEGARRPPRALVPS